MKIRGKTAEAMSTMVRTALTPLDFERPAIEAVAPTGTSDIKTDTAHSPDDAVNHGACFRASLRIGE